MSNKLKTLIGAIIIVIVAVLAGIGININIKPDGTVDIIKAEEEVPTLVVDENGEESEIEADTVQFIDAEVVTEESECPEDSEECAKGAYVPKININSPTTFKDSVLGQCVDFDGAYGSQCFDLFAYFHYVYTGKWLSANGTGAAYGIWDARNYNNSGNWYELIYDTHSIKPGDFVIFHNGRYGHVGMALGYYNNGYVALLGTNQGGSACPGGGSSANIINMSLTSFSGAFRPRIWIQPEPTPEPEPKSDNYVYESGDYFSAVIEKLGLTTENGLWGADGDVNYYNKQLYEQGLLNYYDGKFWNNIPVGTEIVLEAR